MKSRLSEQLAMAGPLKVKPPKTTGLQGHVVESEARHFPVSCYSRGSGGEDDFSRQSPMGPGATPER
jgi:hypothetical protein